MTDKPTIDDILFDQYILGRTHQKMASSGIERQVGGEIAKAKAQLEQLMAKERIDEASRKIDIIKMADIYTFEDGTVMYSQKSVERQKLELMDFLATYKDWEMVKEDEVDIIIENALAEILLAFGLDDESQIPKIKHKAHQALYKLIFVRNQY